MKKISIFILVIAISSGLFYFMSFPALAKKLTKVEDEVAVGRKIQFIRDIYAVDDKGKPDLKSMPKGIAIGPKGKLFAIFLARYEVQVFNAKGEFLYRFGKKGKGEGDFLLPMSIEVAGNGAVFVLDAKLKKVLAFSNGGEFQYEFDFMKRRRPGDKYLTSCTKMALDRRNGVLYFPDGLNCNIKLFDLKGNYVGNYPLPERFSVPGKPYIDSKGNIYLIDLFNGRVHAYNAKKEHLFLFGELGDRLGDFARPIGLSVDAKGNIYVLDRLLSVIQVFNPKGKVLGVIKDTDVPDGLRLTEPFDMVMDDRGMIYLSSQAFQCIKVLKD